MSDSVRSFSGNADNYPMSETVYAILVKNNGARVTIRKDKLRVSIESSKGGQSSMQLRSYHKTMKFRSEEETANWINKKIKYYIKKGYDFRVKPV